MGTGCFAVFCLKRSEPAATGMQPCWLTLQQHPGDSEEEMGKVKKRRVKKKHINLKDSTAIALFRQRTKNEERQ